MRIFDLNELDDTSDLDVDLCIVGSGPAGLSIASELDKGDASVLVLESGGLDDEPDTQALYDIESTGARRILDQGSYDVESLAAAPTFGPDAALPSVL
jgi:choline dehydrogenase-like flavoprotein